MFRSPCSTLDGLLGLLPTSSSLLMWTLGGGGHSTRKWILATSVGDMAPEFSLGFSPGSAGSWPAFMSIWQVKQQVGILSVSQIKIRMQAQRRVLQHSWLSFCLGPTSHTGVRGIEFCLGVSSSFLLILHPGRQHTMAQIPGDLEGVFLSPSFDHAQPELSGTFGECTIDEKSLFLYFPNKMRVNNKFGKKTE